MFYIARLTWNTKTNPFLHYEVHLIDFLLQKDIIEQFGPTFKRNVIENLWKVAIWVTLMRFP